jgi:hypothetical protein
MVSTLRSTKVCALTSQILRLSAVGPELVAEVMLGYPLPAARVSTKLPTSREVYPNPEARTYPLEQIRGVRVSDQVLSRAEQAILDPFEAWGHLEPGRGP